jgi:WD40 repeat protein
VFAVRRRLGGGTIALAVLVVAVAALGGFTPGCKKEQQSLVLVNVQADDTGGGNMTTVTLIIGQPAPSSGELLREIYDLPSGGLPKSPTFVQFGIYVPANTTGGLPVTAIAKPTTGCNGYIGTGKAMVTAGGTVLSSITLHPGDVCMAVGMGGMGGTTGTGGAGGAAQCGTTVGTKPATVPPPTLTNCMEFDHQMGLTCDPTGSTNNPWINMVAVSPDGTLLATAAEDSNRRGEVKIWRIQGSTPTFCGAVFSTADGGPGYIAFSPDGKLFAVAWTGLYVDIFNVPSFSFKAEAQSAGANFIYGVGFSADSQTVLSIDWDGNVDGHLLADRPDGTPITSTMLGVDPDAMAVSPVPVGGGTAIVVPGFDGNFGYYTWNGSSFSAPVIQPTVALNAGTRAGFSPNGMLMAEATEDGSVRFWSLPITATSVPTGTGIMLADVPLGISFSPGSDFVSFSYGTSFDIWNASTRALVSKHSVTGTFADSVTFSASGGAIIGGEDRCGRFLVCQ